MFLCHENIIFGVDNINQNKVMKRVQLFEFEDFSWFPAPIRTAMTNLIVVFHKMLGTGEVIAQLLSKIKTQLPFNQIVDLGSGSGGAMPLALKALNAENESNQVNLLLTDLHPNPKFIKRFDNLPNINYHPHSVNATSLNETPKGLKTMANSFHHMPSDKARAILKSAFDNKEPLLVYEIGENKIPIVLWWLFLPISLSVLFVMVLFMTPFTKPLTWQQLVFTYLIPIIPICYAWDGQASIVRMYTFDDIEILLDGLKSDQYSWEMGQATKKNGKKIGYYLLGLPL